LFADMLLDVLPGEWTLTPFPNQSGSAIYRGSAPGQGEIAVKLYPNASQAQREFAVLKALREFGINLGPEPLALDAERKLVAMSWVEGEILPAPPVADDTDLWHKMMAAVGATGMLPFVQYTSQVPMQGKGIQNPGDFLERMQKALNPENPYYERLKTLIEAAVEQVPPTWNHPPKVGLCRGRYELSDFLYDGCCHVLAVDWDEADWGDMAAEVGLWSAHPDYEELPPSHWVWLRWEFARLTHDEDLVPRATVYGKLGQIWWALKLAERPEDAKTLERYLARAEKAFRVK
jgi:hypothetical protein